ncbi:MAG: YncE family protein, partial [Flavitalea sp.]
MKIRKFIIPIVLTALTIAGCRKDPSVLPIEEEELPSDTSVTGFYLLNEGNMGMNKASLDYYDNLAGTYKRNIYNETNPTAPKELGDVGNDIDVYGGKLYAVINMSDKVEIMDAKTAKRLGQVTIPNCRYVAFANGRAYVSSYAGGVGDPNSPEGFIAEIDTASFAIIRTVKVGRQPEEMAVVNNRIYITNSGGYSPPNYESTVSVIDLNTFTEIKRIEVAINLHRIKADSEGDLYVTSRGDYYNVPSKMFVIDTKTDHVKDSLSIAAGNIVISGDSLYALSVEWSYITNKNEITYALINTKTNQVVGESFITDGSEKDIKLPYGLAVNPKNGDIYITDAKDYVTPGTLYCYDSNGK